MGALVCVTSLPTKLFTTFKTEKDSINTISQYPKSFRVARKTTLGPPPANPTRVVNDCGGWRALSHYCRIAYRWRERYKPNRVGRGLLAISGYYSHVFINEILYTFQSLASLNVVFCDAI